MIRAVMQEVLEAEMAEALGASKAEQDTVALVLLKREPATEGNREHLPQLAEQNTAHDLELILQGEVPVENARVIQLYLAPEDHQRLPVPSTKTKCRTAA